ncbi:MAG: ATP-binding protein [Chloroflexi bacterium]|nr:ATP-binding protein [Chloroflexota bacterium]
MKQIVVLSGKGGTGKTTIAAALAHLASREMSIVLADADVDAANLELVLAPEVQESQDFVGGQVAVINPQTCIACGVCAEVCRFGAVVREENGYRVDRIPCEGCAACFYQCPANAISMENSVDGRWFQSRTRFGLLFHAHLIAARENSGKLVSLVKQRARLAALEDHSDLLIVDGPPGIGCPVIAAATGADLALLITEPTISGAHDLARILALTEHFRIQALVCINKADINPRRAKEVAHFCTERGVPLAGCLPYDMVVTEAMVHGVPVSEYTDGPVTQELIRIWQQVKDHVLVRSAETLSNGYIP